MSDDSDMLISLLKPKKDKYGRDEVYSSVISEGYSKEVAEKVVKELYGNVKVDSPSHQRINKILEEKPNEVPKQALNPDFRKSEINVDATSDIFKEIYANLNEFKELAGPDLTKIEELSASKLVDKKVEVKEDISKSNLEQRIIELEKEIENTSFDLIQMQDGKIIDLSKISRREQRAYRVSGKLLREIKEETLRELKKELRNSHRERTEPESVPERHIRNREEKDKVVEAQKKEESISVPKIDEQINEEIIDPKPEEKKKKKKNEDELELISDDFESDLESSDSELDLNLNLDEELK